MDSQYSVSEYWDRRLLYTAMLCGLCVQFSSILSGPQRIGQRLSNAEYFVAGSLTGCVASLAESPIDLVSHLYLCQYAWSFFLLILLLFICELMTVMCSMLWCSSVARQQLHAITTCVLWLTLAQTGARKQIYTADLLCSFITLSAPRLLSLFAMIVPTLIVSSQPTCGIRFIADTISSSPCWLESGLTWFQITVGKFHAVGFSGCSWWWQQWECVY